MMNTWTTLLLAVSLVLSRHTAAQPAVNQLGLGLSQGEFAVCALEKSTKIPDWALTTTPVSITRSQAALSIIAPNNIVPQGINCDRGWRTFEDQGCLALIIQDEAWKNYSRPGKPDRSGAKMSHVCIKRFGPRDAQEHPTKNEKPSTSAGEETAQVHVADRSRRGLRGAGTR